MEQLGHTVVRMQEDEVSWADRLGACRYADLFWWVQTYDLAHHWDQAEARTAVEKLNGMLPTVSQHLDLWHGLARADQLAVEPFFRTRYVFTADGDHDDGWAALGVNHRWLPPAVYGPECVPGAPRSLFRSDIAFVGSWRGYGHAEWWPQRRAMLDFLRRRYRSRLRFWPRGRAVRGADLNDLYASVKVTVGDSCFADRSTRYFSDRAFETVGRGGFLVMPYIPALAEMLTEREHCAYYTPGDLDELGATIDHYLADDGERERIRAAGQAHVAANHTYAHRVQAVLDVLAADGAIGREAA